MVSKVEDYSSVGAALKAVLRELPAKPVSERIPAALALGRVAAKDVTSSEDVPKHDSSHMDGYAVDSRDTVLASEGVPARLKVVGETTLGEEPRKGISRGQTLRVYTGSFMPPGADAVVPVEDASVAGGFIKVKAPCTRWRYVYRAGEDLRRGEVIVKGGSAVRAQDVGLALNLGVNELDVYRRPVVALLATGSELSDAPEGEKGKVRNSHSAIFVGLVEKAGCVPLNLGIAPDRKSEIRARVRKGLDEADIVMTMGGTSVGRKDLVGGVISSFRPRVMFHGMRMDRGRVAGVAVIGRKAVVMMPGPVQGAMNSFVLSALPIIRRLSGREGSELLVGARLKSKWEARRKFSNFVKVLYVSLSGTGQGLLAEPVLGETESMTTLTRSDGFIVVPESKTSLERGERVDVFLLPGYSFV